MSRRNKPQPLKKEEVVEPVAVVEEPKNEAVKVETKEVVVEETVVETEPVVETEVVETKPEVVTASEGGIEIESKNLSQEQADELAGTVKSAQQKMQENMLLEKQKAAVRQYAFSIFNSMVMSGVPCGSDTNRKKYIELSIETAKDFIKFSKDIDMDGVL